MKRYLANAKRQRLERAKEGWEPEPLDPYEFFSGLLDDIELTEEPVILENGREFGSAIRGKFNFVYSPLSPLYYLSWALFNFS